MPVAANRYPFARAAAEFRLIGLLPDVRVNAQAESRAKQN